MVESQEYVVEMSRFEESFYRRQDSLALQKNGRFNRFYTHRSTRIKLSRTCPRSSSKSSCYKEVDTEKKKKKRKTKTQDKRIARPAYLRPIKKTKTKKNGSKTQRFAARSKDRVKKTLLHSSFFLVNDEE